jgi:Glycosyltransferase family 87
MTTIESIRRWRPIGSGTVIVSSVVIALLVLLYFGNWVGWDPTWRSFGVTPLEPHFFDMHAVTDHAACAAKGFNAYVLNPCNPRTRFNYPPVWLWLGYLGIDGADSAWLSVLVTAAALAVLVALLKGRSIGDGALASMAILSPSVMMGIERGNIDLSILALVGGAALVFAEQRPNRILLPILLIGLAIVLKLYPLFCVALVARFNRRTFLFAAALAALSLVYFAIISDYILIIRQNTPTSFMLSYGYQVPFLGLDHLRAEAGLGALGLANTWVPITLTIVTVILAAATALYSFRCGNSVCMAADSVVGTAFLFGAGIYCGSFLLGTNFIYRLMFLLLCLPQLLDWGRGKLVDDNRTVTSARALLATILFALWMNGNSNGHSTFMFVPQLANWLIFFGLTTILLLNFMNNTRWNAQKNAQP